MTASSLARCANAVNSIPAHFGGYLVGYAHVAYDGFYEGGEVVEVHCWSHASS